MNLRIPRRSRKAGTSSLVRRCLLGVAVVLIVVVIAVIVIFALVIYKRSDSSTETPDEGLWVPIAAVGACDSAQPYTALLQAFLHRKMVPVANGSIATLEAGNFVPSPFVPVTATQVIASHNSYHVSMPITTLQAFAAVDAEAYRLAYSHPPLASQLAAGVRAFELDVFLDPTGTTYPTGPFVGARRGDASSRAVTPTMRPRAGRAEPDRYRVLHIAGLDDRSSCNPLTQCLQILRGWQMALPSGRCRHRPLIVQLEVKAHGVATDFTILEEEILRAVPRAAILTPDDVVAYGRMRRAADTAGESTPVVASVEDAVTRYGWPDAGGRLVFLLETEAAAFVASKPYDASVTGAQGPLHALSGRLLFPATEPGAPEAAFVLVNNPSDNRELVVDAGRYRIVPRNATSPPGFLIPALAQAGYLVRTRADLPVETGLSRSTTRRDAAITSRAHIVSGDYFMPEAYAMYNESFAALFGLNFTPVAANASYRTILPGDRMWRCLSNDLSSGCRDDLDWPL
eukprot:TRINITY_DN68278_c0_g1_i1.p1 TRINITY_DN68278_c0_g1~~TRINITY_DN68278_c0_g1_i1.p1  ORF type:complete len:538 (+),score=71.90 TRINITY_DN68278_c0_g1_i1:73-1614(+)